MNCLKIILIVLIGITMTGCPIESEKDEVLAYLIVKNTSLKPILYYPRYLNKDNLNDTLYPDHEITEYELNNLFVDSTSSALHTLYGYDRIAIEERDNLLVYFFNIDSLKQIPWERIRDEYIVAKRVDFESWEELEECNFTITYP